MFFQNPFFEDFAGSLVLSDRQYSMTFKVDGHSQRGAESMIAKGTGPFTFSGNDANGNPLKILNIWFALNNNNYKNWGNLQIDVTNGGVNTNLTVCDLVMNLTANAQFSGYFTASQTSNGNLLITTILPATRIKFYIANGQAESVLLFNYHAGVAPIPSYFARHTIANVDNFPDSVGMLVYLDPTNDVDQQVINNAVNKKGMSLGYSYTTVLEDWALLKGRSGMFQFSTYGTGLVSTTTTELVYSAGAVAGDLAMKIIQQYGAGSVLLNKFEVPYTLQSGDLVTPPG